MLQFSYPLYFNEHIYGGRRALTKISYGGHNFRIDRCSLILPSNIINELFLWNNFF